MRLSRRELAAAAVVAVVAPSVESQTQQPASEVAKTELAKAVHDANQRNSEALTKFEIPIATEPAFQFKA